MQSSIAVDHRNDRLPPTAGRPASDSRDAVDTTTPVVVVTATALWKNDVAPLRLNRI